MINKNHSYHFYKNAILQVGKEKGFILEILRPYGEYPDLEIILIYNPALQNSDSAFVHISATHGSEGAAGSEVQLQLLKQKGELLLNSQQGFLMIFSLNPFGFHFMRRSSLENIDLNRNIGDGVDAIPSKKEHHWLRPLWRSNSVRDQLLGLAQVLPLSVKTGFTPLARTYAEGQSLEPKGIFYTGNQQAIEIKTTLERIYPLLKNKSRISVLDVHTGIGKLYDETLFHCAGDSVLSEECFSHSIEIPGEKKHSYRGFGLLADRFENAFPQAKVHFVVQELGVKSSAHSFLTLLLENQYHWSHFKKVSPTLYLQHPIKQMVFKTFFSQDPQWISWLQRTGVTRFMEMLNQHNKL